RTESDRRRYDAVAASSSCRNTGLSTDMFDFVRNRRMFYLLSAVFLVPGIISLVLPGGLNPGIDFTSGTIMTIQFDNPVDTDQLRDALTSQLGHSEAVIQQS